MGLMKDEKVQIELTRAGVGLMEASGWWLHPGVMDEVEEEECGG